MSEPKFNLDEDSLSQASPVEPLVVEPQLPIRQVFELLKEKKTGSLLVARGGVLEGLFTERDALNVIADGISLDEPIESVMSKSPVTIEAGKSIGTAIKQMSAGGYRRLPIVRPDGSTEGMIKVSGIVNYLVEHFPSAVYNLPPARPKMNDREGA
ncbi:MAG: CBS domain-containing protein [Pirellulales bacterium]|nr:CBS domain-containing protein [Pirellulales bacterium]